MKQIVAITVGSQKTELMPVITGEEIIEIRSVIKEMPIAEPVLNYAMDLVVSTHGEREDAPEISKKYILNGASPRAAQAIIKTAKARAFVEGRYNVSFEDIQFVAYPALRHRLALNFEAVADGISADAVIRALIEERKTM